VLHE
jgi:WD40 repeat protein